jgi:hypothetical protein
MSWNKSRKALVAGASAIAFTLAVSGCGAAEDEVAEQLTEEAIEQAGDGTEVDIEGEDVTLTDENGDTSSIGTDLPDDFPVDDVPLLDGTIVSATGVAGESYMVMMDVEGEPESVHDEALAMLTDAGYADDTEMSSDGYYATTVTKEGFSVGVTSMAGDGVASVQYLVQLG